MSNRRKRLLPYASPFVMLIRKAISLGASEALLISTDILSIQDEIIEMCRAPKCEGFGQCANCPPHVMGPAEARKWIKNFSEALLVKQDLPPSDLFGPNEMERFQRMFTLVTSLEKIARNRGFEQATGLGAGSCKPVFCPEDVCSVLQGKACRLPHLARPYLEALGINVFELAKSVGWPMNKILRETDPRTVSSAALIGMVLLC